MNSSIPYRVQHFTRPNSVAQQKAARVEFLTAADDQHTLLQISTSDGSPCLMPTPSHKTIDTINKAFLSHGHTPCTSAICQHQSLARPAVEPGELQPQSFQTQFPPVPPLAWSHRPQLRQRISDQTSGYTAGLHLILSAYQALPCNTDRPPSRRSCTTAARLAPGTPIRWLGVQAHNLCVQCSRDGDPHLEETQHRMQKGNWIS